MNVIPLRPSPTHAFAPGDLIGRYRVESVLGEGGMGLVLLAKQVDLDMPVAIKMIRPELAADECIVERLLEEARAVASIRSDNVVRVYDVARLPDRTPYLVFELVEGPDIDRVLAEFGPMSVPDAVAVMLDVCQGLAEAHRRGIVHRDIKPENLLVEPLTDGTSRVKISDFGIAKRSLSKKEMSLTQRTGSVGSPWYMAPEQMVNARDVDPRADVWSAGVVLFELLTGAVPFPGDSPGEVCARVLSQPPLSVRSIRPELPAAVDRIIARCLEKERGHRYTDIGELARDLATLVPAWTQKANGIATRVASEDVELGRTLANIPAVAPAAVLPMVEEAPVVPRPREPSRRGAYALALGAAVALASLALAFGGAREGRSPGRVAESAPAVPRVISSAVPASTTPAVRTATVFTEMPATPPPAPLVAEPVVTAPLVVVETTTRAGMVVRRPARPRLPLTDYYQPADPLPAAPPPAPPSVTEPTSQAVEHVPPTAAPVVEGPVAHAAPVAAAEPSVTEISSVAAQAAE